MDHFALPSDPLLRSAQSGQLYRNFMGYTPHATQPLIGLGVSAIGDAGDAFVQNDKNLQSYQERVARGELPLQRGHLLNDEDRVLRGHILNLMTRFHTHWAGGQDYTGFLDGVLPRLDELAKDGLVRIGAGDVQVTPAGRAFLRNVCMAFDARLIRKTPATTIFSQTV
jgi:oxygen-independent coproporphyrinogen-3 oxidase